MFDIKKQFYTNLSTNAEDDNFCMIKKCSPKPYLETVLTNRPYASAMIAVQNVETELPVIAL